MRVMLSLLTCKRSALSITFCLKTQTSLSLEVRNKQRLFFKINFVNMDRELIVPSNSDKLYSFSEDIFRYMCVLSGCDYLPSMRGIGLNRTFAAIKQKPAPRDAINFLKEKQHNCPCQL